jgi:hypothetical protein
MTDTGGSHADTSDMYMVHTTFRREFGALPSLVRNVQAGDIRRSRSRVHERFLLIPSVSTGPPPRLAAAL